VDVFLTYRTNAVLASREQPGLQVLPVPQAFNVRARYGLALLVPATDAARHYVQFLRGPQGQAILSSCGFSAP
jgi:ABC-type molybdate transport system substrate-binding protein